MFSKKNIVGEIEKILKGLPSREQMMRDLTMGNVVVRHKDGDMAVVKSLDPQLLEKVWKIYQLRLLIHSNVLCLEKDGVRPTHFTEHISKLFEELEYDIHSFSVQNDSISQGGFVELEVFKQKKPPIN